MLKKPVKKSVKKGRAPSVRVDEGIVKLKP